jgi:uncharacterized protein
MSRAFDTIKQFSKMLRNLDRWLDKAVEHATAKPFDPNVLVHARLAPDQFSLDRQVQSACDAAKFAAVYLTGKQAPPHPDTEKTVAELKARIAAVLDTLDGFQEADFADADERKVSPPWLHGKWLRGDHYLLEVATANFYFHVTTAYSILRHNGVPLGKMDFIGPISVQQ